LILSSKESRNAWLSNSPTRLVNSSENNVSNFLMYSWWQLYKSCGTSSLLKFSCVNFELFVRINLWTTNCFMKFSEKLKISYSKIVSRPPKLIKSLQTVQNLRKKTSTKTTFRMTYITATRSTSKSLTHCFPMS
jgi:hypothetical protein